MKGLFATPEYIGQKGERVARWMTKIIDGISLEEAQGKAEDKECICGDKDSEHLDGEECFIVGCGCKTFEAKEE